MLITTSRVTSFTFPIRLATFWPPNDAAYCAPVSSILARQQRNGQVAGAHDTVYGSDDLHTYGTTGKPSQESPTGVYGTMRADDGGAGLPAWSSMAGPLPDADGDRSVRLG